MIIFGNFPSREQAEAFLQEVKHRFPNHGPTQKELDKAVPTDFDPYATAVVPSHGVICDSLEEMDTYETFPFHVDAPIVLIHRAIERDGDKLQREMEIEELVEQFGGRFYGT